MARPEHMEAFKAEVRKAMERARDAERELKVLEEAMHYAQRRYDKAYHAAKVLTEAFMHIYGYRAGPEAEP